MDKQPLLSENESRRTYTHGVISMSTFSAVPAPDYAIDECNPPSKKKGMRGDFRLPIKSLAVDYAAETDKQSAFQGTSDKGPFERLDSNPGIAEFAKMLLLGATLLPLRLVAAFAIIFSYYIFSMSYVALNPDKKYSRGTLRGLTRFASRSLLFVCGFHRIEVFGEETLREHTMMIVSNHISFWEILYFMSSPCCPAFAFKSDCLKVPLIGGIALKVLQGIRVDRSVVGGGTKAMMSAVQRMKDAESSDEFRPLLVFPEGTTGNGSSILSFRSGSFVPGVTVKPVVINFPFECFSPAYESIYTSVLLFRTLTQFNNRMQVRYLEEYIPSEEEIIDAKLFAENVRGVMARAANIPKCEAGYTEKRQYHMRLGKRLQSHPLGWTSNFLFVNPKPLSEETSMDALAYQYGWVF
mmetsp:Transcript_51176/g.153751  ORF Transcript_51176/g.153751 Transcript_51176/m.153751 type:complete len:410 (-) Transcript_51176:369-1598(-)